MSAVLRECAAREFTRNTREKQRDVGLEQRKESDRDQAFWQWFAVALLLFCWCAEASMCAQRGF